MQIFTDTFCYLFDEINLLKDLYQYYQKYSLNSKSLNSNNLEEYLDKLYALKYTNKHFNCTTKHLPNILLTWFNINTNILKYNKTNNSWFLFYCIRNKSVKRGDMFMNCRVENTMTSFTCGKMLDFSSTNLDDLLDIIFHDQPHMITSI